MRRKIFRKKKSNQDTTDGNASSESNNDKNSDFYTCESNSLASDEEKINRKVSNENKLKIFKKLINKQIFSLDKDKVRKSAARCVQNEQILKFFFFLLKGKNDIIFENTLKLSINNDVSKKFSPPMTRKRG
jgi:hypothetical protein